MNNYFRKSWLIGILVVIALFFFYEVIKFSALSFTPITKISNKTPIIERGFIVDRTGKPLAVQTNFYHVGVSVSQIKNPSDFAQGISKYLDMSKEEIEQKIKTSDSSSFIYLKKKIDQATYQELKKYTDSKDYNFVRYDRIPGRIYPENTLASQVIGYMGDDGKGLAGIEYSMQSLLQPIFNPDDSKIPQGKNIHLTLDTNLQYKLEQIAHETMESTHAESIMLIAADSKNGEILSYISLPSANLNEYNYSRIEETIDRPAMTAYEPGSVFKIFTVALLYDKNLISANDSFLCDGLYEHRKKGSEAIRIKCLHYHGWITPREALKYSCNDALGQISDRISDEDFIAGIRNLGFGQRTGIELPGETAGSVKDSNSKLWSGRSKPTIAIGQEISVSALQMVQAATAIANKGVPLNLTLIKKITNKDGSLYFEHEPTPKERIFKESTADYLLSCMETTASTGTGSRAKLHDISIGVKTGTAQMADSKKGGYSTTDFISNCIAIFPIENPQVILYIVVTKAKGETYAGRIVAPVIAQAADTIIDHLGMSRGDAASLEHNGKIKISNKKAVQIGEVVPNFIGMAKKDLLPLLSDDKLQITINGSGWVKTQNPAPGTPITENMTIELNLE